MTLLEQLEQQLKQLPPEKQNEVLDFVAFCGSGWLPPSQPGSVRCANTRLLVRGADATLTHWSISTICARNGTHAYEHGL